ncbi:MAG: SURF1 family protein [Proteobacteria bacterium]|nr:SURF1 family protein [Pseudomonadota bacterium]
MGQQYIVTGKKRRAENTVWLIPSVAAIVCFLLFVNLGRWQLERAQQKDLLFASFEQQQQTAAAPGLTSNESVEKSRYQHRKVYGHYDSAHQFLLDNMVHEGRVGFQVLTPLILPDRQRALLINRGWIPLVGSRQNLPQVTVDSGLRQVTGRIDRLPRAGFRPGPGVTTTRQHWPRLALFPTTSELEDVLDYPLFDFVLLLDKHEPDGYLRQWRPTVMSANQHRGYAFQWFAMATVIMILFTALSWKYWTRRPRE